MNKRDIYIFGTKETADMAGHYFETDSDQYIVKGFIEDNPLESNFRNKPVISYEEAKKVLPPSEIDIFVPIIKNILRSEISARVKKDGYNLPSYISSKAIIWDKNAIGDNCFIQEFNNIQLGTKVGNNCIFWAGNHIGHHGNIGNNVFFTSHVVLSGKCEVEDFCYFGVNATIKDGLKISQGTMLGMGCSQTKNTEEWSLYLGSPSKKIGSSKKYL